MSDLRLVALNLHAGAGNQGEQKARHAVNLMDDEDADVGVFTETKTAVRHLRRKGLRILGESPLSRNRAVLPEQGGTVIAVNGPKIRAWWTAVQKLRWVVRRYNRWHDPRRDQVAMLKGPVRGVRAVHLPPGGPNSVNGDAWRAQMDDALDWVTKRGCRIICGDLNASADTVRAYTLHRGVGGLWVDGRGVDLIIVANGTVTHRNLGDQGPGFDHKAHRFDVTANRTHRRNRRHNR